MIADLIIVIGDADEFLCALAVAAPLLAAITWAKRGGEGGS